MNTIKTIIEHNRIFKKKNPFNNNNLNLLYKDIDKLIDDYNQNNKKIIENIILNILNKKDINNDEIDILTNIINKLYTEEMNVLRLSTLFIIIDKIFLIKRENIDKLVSQLNSIDNKDIKNYLTLIQGKTVNSLNLKKLKQGDLFRSPEGPIIELFGFFKVNNKKLGLLYKKEGEKSKVDSILLDDLITYPKVNNNDENREKFKLSKAMTGENPKIERLGDRLYMIFPSSVKINKQNRIIYKDSNTTIPLPYNNN
jgi:hypothetical protein